MAVNRMLSKNTLKFIKSLHQKKFRKQEGAFFVEGTKIVTELLQSDFEITHLLFTSKFGDIHSSLIKRHKDIAYEVSVATLESLGEFKTNETVLAVAKTKPNNPILPSADEWIIALDDVRDPGNLGTIIRIADWYGIQKLVLSLESADYYNPKVLHASMGSFTRVSVYYTELLPFLQDLKRPVYGAFLDGKSIYQSSPDKAGVILMGNESNGISQGLNKAVTDRITIPRFGHAESLNVAVATAIICDNIKRQS
jgi:RNA methyltransferase, TrmH family